MSVGQMTVGQMTVGEMTVPRLFHPNIVSAKCLSARWISIKWREYIPLVSCDGCPLFVVEKVRNSYIFKLQNINIEKSRETLAVIDAMTK